MMEAARAVPSEAGLRLRRGAASSGKQLAASESVGYNFFSPITLFAGAAACSVVAPPQGCVIA